MYKNKLLIARPCLTDPVFSKKVVLIVYSEDDGTVGFILNGEPVGKVAFGRIEALDDAPVNSKEAEEKVNRGLMEAVFMRYGGPCGQEMIMLHNYEEFADKDEEESEYDLGITYKDQNEALNFIGEGIYFGGPEIFARICTEYPDERKFLFLSGTAKWGPDQLESEIEMGAWDVIDADPEIVFDPERIAELVS